ncbi:MAG: CehA/McbA family metallohydrolase [Pseudomonadales bacterium]
MALLLACSPSSPVDVTNAASDDIVVRIGRTPIPAGEALGTRDITVSNKYFSASFGVDTASPWGVATGGILDIGIVRGETIGEDFVSLVDFMPNYWSAWPTTYQRVSIESSSSEKVVVLTERDWGEVKLETRFEIFKEMNSIRIVTEMRNASDHGIENIRSGYIAWPSGGYLFGMPGLPAKESKPVPDAAATGRWSASYDREWALALHPSFSTLVAYGGRDRYNEHSLAAGAAPSFETWLQIEPGANLSRFVETDMALSAAPGATLSGSISTAKGQPVKDSVLVVQHDGKAYTWAVANELGEYELRLPAGEYEVFAAAAGFGSGKAQVVSLVAAQSLEMHLKDLRSPAELQFSIVDAESNKPLHALVSIAKGPVPAIEYFGSSRFFTELDAPGIVRTSLPPGAYEFDVASAAGFESELQSLAVSLQSGEKREQKVAIEFLSSPAARSWHSADLHHHSDVLDGFTEPEYVLRAQLAAGLNLTFLSDHDSVVNNADMNKLSSALGMSFIGGTELSASWAHFNAYPIDVDKQVDAAVGSYTAKQIFAEARRLGAKVVHVNHPYGNYGYFSSLELDRKAIADAAESKQATRPAQVVAGGYDSGFDLIEITVEHVPKTLEHAWDLWNQGIPAYFAAGSDVHDVWNVELEHASGSARSYVHVEGELTVDSFVDNLKAGHSYASQGPLIYPELMFGSEQTVSLSNELLLLRYQMQAISGLDTVQLIEQGRVIDSKTFSTSQDTALVKGSDLIDVEFSVSPASDTWYSLVAKDRAGKYAYSNPVWVKTASPANP